MRITLSAKLEIRILEIGRNKVLVETRILTQPPTTRWMKVSDVYNITLDASYDVG